MRRRAPAITAGAFAAAIAACNALTGAGDLAIDDGSTEPTGDGGVTDASRGADRRGPADVDLQPTDGAVAEAGCTSTSPTALVGQATALAPGTYELTPATSNRAGAVVAPVMTALDAFDLTFDYSLTFASGTPGAGVTFFAIAAPMSSLTCNVGPALCTLAASAPGFAVILRTSKAQTTDPAVPYLAVVDAQSYPASLPAKPLLLDDSMVTTPVPFIDPGGPRQEHVPPHDHHGAERKGDDSDRRPRAPGRRADPRSPPGPPLHVGHRRRDRAGQHVRSSHGGERHRALVPLIARTCCSALRRP